MMYSHREQVSHHYVQVHLNTRIVYLEIKDIVRHFQLLAHYQYQAHNELPRIGAALLKVPMSSTINWFLVLLNGVRHNIPDMDTLAGLEMPDSSIYTVDFKYLKTFEEGEPLEPCDPAWESQACKKSIYYKALHNLK